MKWLTSLLLVFLFISSAASQQPPPPVTNYPAGWAKIGAPVSINAVNGSSTRAALGWTTASPKVTTAPPTANVCNTGSVGVYISFGDVTVVASSTTSMLLVADTCRPFALGGATYAAARTGSGSATIVIETGIGSVAAVTGAGGGGGCAALAGDITGPCNANVVSDIQGNPVTGTTGTGNVVFGTGGNVSADVVTVTGGTTAAALANRFLPKPTDFGADPTGVADSTTALNAWLASASVSAPALGCGSGTYQFTNTLVGPTTLNNFVIAGDGSTQCVFKYTGASTTIDLFTGGNVSTNVSGWNLSGFRITSTTTMTAGNALHLKRLSQSRVHNVYSDCTDQTNGQKLWNGFRFNGIHEVELSNFCAYGLNVGVALNGIDATSSNDFWLNNGHLDFNGLVGLLLGGKIGIVWVDNVELIGNGGASTGAQIRIDQTLATSIAGAVGLVLSDTVHADGLQTNGNYIVEINDTNATGGIIVLNGVNGSAVLDGVKVTAWPSGTIQANGRTFNNLRDGFRIDDATTKVAFGAAAFVDSNGGYGVNATAATTLLSTWARTFSNTTADYSANTGLVNPYAAEVAFTPTVTSATGTITSYTAAGTWTPIANTKLVAFTVDITITNNGSGAGSLNFTLPTTSARTTALPLGREIVTSGSMLTATLTATSNVAQTVTYANLYPAITTSRVVGSGVYERQ